MKSIKENSGSSIQGVASAVMVGGVIISLVIACIPTALLCSIKQGGAGVVTFIIVMGIGCLISWVISIFMRGFGEIVQYTAESATYLEAIDNLTTSKTMPVSNQSASSVTTSTPTNATNQNQVRCDICGTMNHYRNQVCVSCGHSLKQ